jgi:hypothetical protein
MTTEEESSWDKRLRFAFERGFFTNPCYKHMLFWLIFLPWTLADLQLLRFVKDGPSWSSWEVRLGMGAIFLVLITSVIGFMITHHRLRKVVLTQGEQAGPYVLSLFFWLLLDTVVPMVMSMELWSVFLSPRSS